MSYLWIEVVTAENLEKSLGLWDLLYYQGGETDRQKNAGVCMLWHACRGQKTTSDGTLPSSLIKAFSLLFLHCVCQTSSPICFSFPSL